MIKASELRIGNLVIWNPKLSNSASTLSALQIEVVAILSDKIFYVFPNIENRVEPFEDDVAQFGERFKTVEELEPITLTAEVLELSGFIKEGGLLSSKNYEKGPLKLKHNGTAFQISDLPKSNSISSLHQLQNLYFSLTGEELEVKLHGQQA